MIVKNREYDYLIEPFFNKVKAEVFKITKDGKHIFLLSKTFGKWWRDIKEQDYKDAKNWADNQLKNIYTSNKGF